MSKTLYLVRHAKSSWNNKKLMDWKRPLLKIGIERATKVSNILKRKKIRLDKIISSRAIRAINTAKIFSLRLNYPVDKIECIFLETGK